MKKHFKLIALFFAFWLVLFNPVNISLVYAQESTPTDTPIATDLPSPTDSPTSTPTPTPDQNLTTGDSTSSADSTINSNILSATTSPTPTETPIATDSATPDPEATTSATPTDTPTSTPTPTPTSISADQSANVNANTNSDSNSGNNSQQSASGSASMTTGESTSTANSITVTNLAEVNSNLITTVQNILNSNTTDVNLYDALEAAIANNPNYVPSNATITATQNADINTNTSSSSNSGNNSQDPTTASVTTGNSISIANTLNAINLNLIGSNTVLAIINVLSDWNGNIILPSGTQLSTNFGTSSANVTANQNADVTANTTSTSATGGNTQTGQNSTMTTGQAISSANSNNLVNIIQIGNGLGFLVINNYGNWTGNLINWNSPGSIQTLPSGNNNLVTNYGNNENNGSGNTNVISNQTANVNTTVSSNANTGSNTQVGKITNLTTGNASSLANNFTLANYTGVGGGLFFGVVNILGNWTGNIIAAYPELKVSLTDNQDSVNPGGPENYLLTVTNSGHSTAHGTKLNFTFPNDVTPDGSESTSWSLGDLNPGQTQTFSLTGHVENSATNNDQLIANASTSTTDIQDSSTGNNASDTTTVVVPPGSQADTRTPDLHVDTWTNVTTFINTGDTIWASITVNNNNSYIAHNVQVHGKIYDDNNTLFTPLNWNLGDVRANGHAKISFNVKIPQTPKAGNYHLAAEATGNSESGDSSSSNLSTSDFLVKNINGQFTSNVVIPPTINLPGTISTNGGGSGGQVLGTSTQANLLAELTSKVPYVFSILAFAYLSIVLLRNKFLKKNLKFKLPRNKKLTLAGGIMGVIIAIGLFIKKR